MKILAEGTRKVLLIDPEAISRNAERGLGNCQTVATVATVDDTGAVLSIDHGMTVDVRGEVKFEYSQHAFLFVINRVPLRGAWITYAEVVIDAEPETEEEQQDDPQTPAAPAATTAPEPPTVSPAPDAAPQLDLIQAPPRTPNRPARKTAVVTEGVTA
ncbi:hypothetical protein [Stenotrophomonas muris]|uniref:hypothetical protein n=1 Tax=Stenotrophomonas muris TaxID=2963283 RepID=UPI0040558D1E